MLRFFAVWNMQIGLEQITELLDWTVFMDFTCVGFVTVSLWTGQVKSVP